MSFGPWKDVMYGATTFTTGAALAESHPRYDGPARACRLVATLRAAGLQPMLMYRGPQVFAGGLTLVMERNESTLADALESLRAAAASGIPVGLHVSPCMSDADLPQELIAELRATLATLRPGSLLSIEGVAASRPGLEACLPAAVQRLRRFAFGDRGRGLTPEMPGAPETHRTVAGVGEESAWLPAMHAGVRSRCPLLSAEPTTTLLPAMTLAVPAHTAWLPIAMDLGRFLNGAGEIDLPRLESGLDVAVDCGDELFDELVWCGERQTEDARLNRRIAVCLTGVGDLVARLGMEPASLDCLRHIDRLVSNIHERLWQRSAALAKSRCPLPALTEKQPSGRWRDESHRRDWARRWQQAVSKVQVRNRNLLAISPYSIIPGSDRPTSGCADLMPVLAHADVIGFSRPPMRAGWKRADFRSFQLRMQAQLERFNATTLIAAGA